MVLRIDRTEDRQTSCVKVAGLVNVTPKFLLSILHFLLTCEDLHPLVSSPSPHFPLMFDLRGTILGTLHGTL